MIIDYMPGGHLFNIIQIHGHLTESQVRFYAAEVLLALDALHQQSIIYRDLKPENILLDELGHIKLTDFNLSKIILESDKCNSFAGTAEYLAPEVVQRENYTNLIDFWTLGILIYEMLAGISPFKGSNRSQIFEKILNNEVVYKPWFSNEAKVLIGQLL